MVKFYSLALFSVDHLSYLIAPTLVLFVLVGCIHLFGFLVCHILFLSPHSPLLLDYSAGTVEYTDCISAEGYAPNECPWYGTKPSYGEDLA